MKRAVIGLDGLSEKDLKEFGIGGDWFTHDIDTVAHTCPSWNAIFSGIEMDGLHGFFKVPDEYEEGNSIASQSSEKWEYEELHDGKYIWDLYPIDVTSAPVVLPTFSTIWDSAPLEYGWPATREETAESIRALSEKTMEYDDVITVFPIPDKCNHLSDNSNKDYTDQDRKDDINLMMEKVDELTSHFDEWVLVSDHGRPSRREWATDDLWVASHYDTGLIRSNSVDLSSVESNLDIFHCLKELFE